MTLDDYDDVRQRWNDQFSEHGAAAGSTVAVNFPKLLQCRPLNNGLPSAKNLQQSCALLYHGLVDS